MYFQMKLSVYHKTVKYIINMHEYFYTLRFMCSLFFTENQ